MIGFFYPLHFKYPTIACLNMKKVKENKRRILKSLTVILIPEREA